MLSVSSARRRLTLAILPLFYAFGLLFSAAPAQAAAESKGKKIAYLQSLATHPYVVATSKAFRERGEALGMEITFFTSMLDAALQAQQIDDAIARKFDLVVVVPTSEQAIVPALARAKAAGIPVILVNNSPKDGTEDLYLTFVGQDQTEMGRLAGVSLLDALKESGRDGGKVAMITGALQQGIAPRRVAGFREALGHRDERAYGRAALRALCGRRRAGCGLRHG
jgi:ABC-type sugar transport system substrate-binding protein